ncbi:MAG: hypothetical protein AAFN76_09800 [Pseudomonadota bacterium]
MSILDFGFNDVDTFLKGIENAMPLMEVAIDELGLSDHVLGHALREGISPHIALGLSGEHLDALFTIGLHAMQAGEIAKAQIVFQKLVTLKSIDERYWYALGTSMQMQDRVAEAARAYIIALGLKATDVEGYLRLGECLLAAKEVNEALACFQMASSLCDDGHGDESQKQMAERYVAHTNQRQKSEGVAE